MIVAPSKPAAISRARVDRAFMMATAAIGGLDAARATSHDDLEWPKSKPPARPRSTAPIFLGGGERLLDNLGGALVDYEVVEQVLSPKATHVRVVRKGAPV
jgi:hypothetical protein